jgi:hypothetical protein
MKDRVTLTDVSDQDEAPSLNAELRIILQADTRWKRKLSSLFLRRLRPSRKGSS